MNCVEKNNFEINERFDVNTRVGRKYSNYKFYFIETIAGVKEVKAIHIYDNNKKLITLNNAWFNGVNEINFPCKIDYRKSIDFDGQIFVTQKANYNHVELYIPNTIAMFEKMRTEESTGFFKEVDVYKTKNPILGCHEERVNAVENTVFISKVRATCINSKKES